VPAGYSGTPLAKKLGIKDEFRVRFVNVPRGYRKQLGKLPPKVSVLPATSRSRVDLIHVFISEKKALRRVANFKKQIVSNGMIWVSWPKQSSPLATELKESDVRASGLASGLVDVKICAVDDDWSGLKFVIPVKDR
jgi:hypothetical protein